jgi:hypothetical protein
VLVKGKFIHMVEFMALFIFNCSSSNSETLCALRPKTDQVASSHSLHEAIIDMIVAKLLVA